MNSPGRGAANGSLSGSRSSVTESRFSTTRLPTRYGTGAISLVIGGRHLRHFLGDVDAGRAPGDAPAAADAARHLKLVVPGAQLVGQPMPVPRSAGLANAALVHEREVEFEAGCPVLPAFG